MDRPPAPAVVAEHSWMFLGEDRHGWVIAMMAAVVAAFIYELTMSAVRKVTLRIPFLILLAGRPLMSRAAWETEYPEWRGELWNILHERDRPWLTRLLNGVWWSLAVVLRGRQTAMADGRVREGRKAPKVARLRRPRVTIRVARRSPRGRWQETLVVMAAAVILVPEAKVLLGKGLLLVFVVGFLLLSAVALGALPPRRRRIPPSSDSQPPAVLDHGPDVPPGPRKGS